MNPFSPLTSSHATGPRVSKRALFSLLLALGTTLSAQKPNIILIFTDDHGYADLSCMGYEKDIKTPNIDKLATEGVRFTDGYVTAPQCCPSRAALMTGRDQNRFGFLTNGYGPLPLEEKTIADHLTAAGYTTGMVGKWHLEPNHSDKAFLEKHQITNAKVPPKLDFKFHPRSRGFRETFFGYVNSYSVTYDLIGNRFDEPKTIKTTGDRLDRQSEAAVRFIDLHHDKPFFLYLAYYGPHVPTASSKKYLDRFPGEMPERRRYALAMMSAIDDGVGAIAKKLTDYKIDKNTLIIFISDNGAPLKLTMKDDPIHLDGAYWDGSKNTPLNGEKGMLADGGIRVPYVMHWKGAIPPAQVISTSVTTLDVVPTILAAAKAQAPKNLDGQNLLPMLIEKKPLAERTLHWRFWNQSAARKGDWKLLNYGTRQSFLFNLADDKEEKNNLINKHPEIAKSLQQSLDTWGNELSPKGFPEGIGNPAQEINFYHHFFQVPKPEKK